MSETRFDIRDFIDEKRVYNSLSDKELDFSFRPAALDVIWKKYSELERKVAEKYPSYVKLHTEYINKVKEKAQDIEEYEAKANKEVEDYTLLLKETRDLGIKMIITAAQANKQDIDEEWINENIDAREFGYILRFIMGVEQSDRVKKK